jgi:hypothetical protein
VAQGRGSSEDGRGIAGGAGIVISLGGRRLLRQESGTSTSTLIDGPLQIVGRPVIEAGHHLGPLFGQGTLRCGVVGHPSLRDPVDQALHLGAELSLTGGIRAHIGAMAGGDLLAHAFGVGLDPGGQVGQTGGQLVVRLCGPSEGLLAFFALADQALMLG